MLNTTTIDVLRHSADSYITLISIPLNPIEKVLPPQRQKRLLPASSKEQLGILIIQSSGSWETPDMVSHYAASLVFDDALELYHKLNGVQ